jgi:hypothetical protein
VIASILPGLREIRAPLAAGYVWMLGLWLVAAPNLPVQPPTSGLYADVYRLAKYVGTPAVIAGISLVAYLAGVLSIAAFNAANAASARVPLPERIESALPGYRSRRRVDEEATNTVLEAIQKRFRGDEEFRKVLVEHIKSVQEKAHKSGRKLVSPLDEDSAEELVKSALSSTPDQRYLLFSVIDTHRVIDDLTDDLRYIPARLVGTDAADLYAEYSRLDAEADFRYGLSLPLGFLFVVLSARLHSAWLLGLLVSIMLAYLGAQTRTESRSHLLAAISSGRVISPVVARLTSGDNALRDYDELTVDDSRSPR